MLASNLNSCNEHLIAPDLFGPDTGQQPIHIQRVVCVERSKIDADALCDDRHHLREWWEARSSQGTGKLRGRLLIAYQNVPVPVAIAVPVEIETSARPYLDYREWLASSPARNELKGWQQVGAPRHLVGLQSGSWQDET